MDKMAETYAEISNMAVSAGKLGNEWVLTLNIWSSGAQHQFLIGSVDDVERIAREFNKTILAAGREGKRARSGLVVVEGGNDAAFKRPQGGLTNGKSHTRPPRSPA